jgi:molybdenum cofactor cytidylyltransferase
MGLTLAKALRISKPTSIAFAGAGGKTTAMFKLARELTPPVIVTSTTHLGVWQIPLADKHIVAESPAPLEEIEHGLNGIVLVTGPIQNDKTTPIEPNLLEWLREYCGYHDLPLLIEADGSRQKPLKAPAFHEPAITAFVEQVVYVAGLSGLGKPLTEEFVHRPEIFANLSGLKIGKIISAESMINVLSHPEGGLKGIPQNAMRTLLLNQADTALLQSTGGKMAELLLDSYDKVLVGSLQSDQNESLTLQVSERVAGIILAAGASTRFGQPKQLLDWHGRPFVRVVAETALAAGLSPVIVVTGSNAEQVENALKGSDVKIVRNQEWQNGQSSSVKAGITTLTPSHPHPNPQPGDWLSSRPAYADLPLQDAPRGEVPARAEGVGAAIFLLADQPQIGSDVIRALKEAHAQSLSSVIAPLVLEEQRANPVLFDQVTFPDLLKLEGDVGGRAIFSKYKVEYLPWHDDRLLLDVDKPEDYRRLIEDETL